MENVNITDQKDLWRHHLNVYREKSLPIISLLPREKLSGKRKLPETKPLNQEMIEEWLARVDLPNIGLILGSCSGIVCVELDGNGKELQKKLKEISNGVLPKTWTFKSPSGGLGFLYQIPPDLLAKRVNIWRGDGLGTITLLGDGSYTIIPPSICEGSYSWAEGISPENIRIAEAPPWIIEKMCRASDTHTSKVPLKNGGRSSDGAYAIEHLSKHCSCFDQDRVIQASVGLDEDRKYKWFSIFVSTGLREAALEFSRLSGKHDESCEKRIKFLAEKVGADGGPMIRCTTFGCTEDKILNCFKKINRNAENEPTNSPGAFLKQRPDPPGAPAYQPYITALEQTEDYTINDDGWLCLYNSEGEPVKIANFVARVDKEIIRDDGVNQTKSFIITGILAGGISLHEIEVSADDFAGMRWLASKWGIKVNIKPGSRCKECVRDAIQQISINAPVHMVYTHLGWREIDGKMVFLHSGGSVGAENVSVDVEIPMQKYYLPRDVSNPKKVAMESFRLLKLAPYRVTIPLLAFIYLGPLTEWLRCEGIAPNFVFWLYGGTGTRKTSIGKLFLSHYGRFDNPPCTFNDTINSIEKRLFIAKNVVILVDDFHPCVSNTEAQKMSQSGQKLCRMVGDGIGRARVTQTMEAQKYYPPRGLVMVTGEDVLKGSSTTARIFSVEMERGDVDLKLLTEFQKTIPLFGEAMVCYLQFLCRKIEGLPGELHAEFSKSREYFQAQGGHGRTGEAAAWLKLGFLYMLRFMLYVKVCDADEGKELLKEATKILTELIDDQKELSENENPANVFIKALKELLSSKKVRVAPLADGLENDPYSSTIGEFIGYFDERFLYLFPQVSYSQVNRFLGLRNEHIPVSEAALWRRMNEASMIKTDVGVNGRLQFCPKKVIPGKNGSEGEKERIRLLHLYRKILEENEDAA